MVRATLTSLAVLCCAAPAASANTLQELYDRDGNPHVFVSAPSRGLQAARSCPPGGAACTPVPVALEYKPGDTAPGTVLEFDYADGTTDRTSPWQGRLTATAPPTLDGTPEVGSTVRAVGGTWQGGYGAVVPFVGPPRGDSSQFRVIACAEPAAGECWALGEAAVTLAERWAGWHLTVEEFRYSADTAFTLALPKYPQRATLAAAPGSHALSAPVKIAALPSATLRDRALRRNGRLQLGRVTCERRCTVKLTVAGRSRTFRVHGTRTLTTPLRTGRVQVRVVVDGRALATKRVTAR